MAQQLHVGIVSWTWVLCHFVVIIMYPTYVFLTYGALLAVVSIRDTWSTTYSAAALVRAIVTLVTDTYQSTGTHIRVTHHTLPITCMSQKGGGGHQLECRHDVPLIESKVVSITNLHFSHRRPIAALNSNNMIITLLI